MAARRLTNFSQELPGIILLKDNSYKPVRGFWLFVSQTAIAAGIMSIFSAFATDTEFWQQWRAPQRCIHLISYLLASIAINAVTLRMLGIRLKRLLTQ